MKGNSQLVDRLRRSLHCGTVATLATGPLEYPSMPLTEVAVQLFDKSVTSGPKGLDVFDLNFAAQVSRQACITPTSIMVSMIYLERLKAKNPEYLRRVSTCDLFLVSIVRNVCVTKLQLISFILPLNRQMIASKFLFDDGEDDEVFNDEWAASADIDVKQLNRLEREFLNAINWSLFVDSQTFFKQLSRVEALISLNESSKRGTTGMTYSELIALFNYSISKDDALWTSLLTCISKVLLVSSLAYWLTVATLLGSTGIALSSVANIHIKHIGSNQSLVIQTNHSTLGLNVLSNKISKLSLCDIRSAQSRSDSTQSDDKINFKICSNIAYDWRPNDYNSLYLY